MPLRIWQSDADGDYGTAGNWSTSTVPIADDEVEIQGTVSITGTLDQSGVGLDAFRVNPNYTGTIGTIDGFLQISFTTPLTVPFRFAGRGQAFIDLSAAAVSAIVDQTANPTNDWGLYLDGSALTTVTVNDGSVHIGLPLSTATITTLEVRGGSVFVSDEITLTTLNMFGGEVQAFCDTIATANINGGTLRTGAACAITTCNLRNNGTLISNATGTIGTLNQYGGVMDLSKSEVTRIISVYNAHGGTCHYSTSATLSANIATAKPMRITT